MFKRRKPDDRHDLEPGAASPPVPEFPDQGSPGDHPVTPGGPIDNGLGVPPFRPARPQEVQLMSRQPFTTAPAPRPLVLDPACRRSVRRAIRRSAAPWSSVAASASRARSRMPNAWWSRARWRPA